MQNIEAMLSQAIETLLWSTVDGQDDVLEPLDENYDASDLTPEAVTELRGDLIQFVALVAREGSSKAFEIIMRDATQAAHDFILTRNHHGAGFWDRGYGDAGDELTSFAHTFGSVDAYVGDDGRIYV